MWSELAVVAFVVTVVLTPLAIVVATRTGIMDRPGELKEQDRPVPYLGGVAVLAGVLVAVLSDRPDAGHSPGCRHRPSGWPTTGSTSRR